MPLIISILNINIIDLGYNVSFSLQSQNKESPVVQLPTGQTLIFCITVLHCSNDVKQVMWHITHVQKILLQIFNVFYKSASDVNEEN